MNQSHTINPKNRELMSRVFPLCFVQLQAERDERVNWTKAKGKHTAHSFLCSVRLCLIRASRSSLHSSLSLQLNTSERNQEQLLGEL